MTDRDTKTIELIINNEQAKKKLKILKVGNGYSHGNGGDLEILNSVYRHEHRLGKMRQRKPWLNKSWYISTMVLKDKIADVAGEEFAGLFDNLTQRERGLKYFRIFATP